MNSKLPFGENENGTVNVLYFILDQSRSEPLYKRANILMSASCLRSEKAVAKECYHLANELFDVAQIVSRHAAAVRLSLQDKDPLAPEVRALTYLLDRMEEQPIEVQIELLGSMTGIEVPDGTKAYEEAYNEVARFNQKFEQLLFRLRSRQFEHSNREAVAEYEEEQRLKKSAKAAASKKPEPLRASA